MQSPLRQAPALFSAGPFRRYALGEAVSMTGTWMQAMAQGWLMTTLTSSALMLGLVHFASGVPMLLLTLAAGSLADRYDKRWILIAALGVQIGLAALTGYLVISQTIQLWHVLAMAVVLGVASAVEMPAAAAIVPELVKKEEIAAAIAVDRSIFHGTRLVGPALGGWAIAAWGTASAFFLNALSFLPLAIALLTIRPREVGSAEEEAQRQGGLGEAFSFVRGERTLLATLMLMALTTLLVFPVMIVLLPLYAVKALGLGPDAMGLLMALTGVGGLGGSIGLLSVPRERRMLFMAGACACIVAAMWGLSLARHLPVAGVALVALALSISTLTGLSNTLVQERAPDAMRGRVSAIAGLSFFGLLPFSGLLVTSLADWLGMREALGLSGLLFGAGAVLLLANLRGTLPVAAPSEAQAS